MQRAANALANTVGRIRYDFGSDWTGDPSIFFSIVLTDEAAKKPRLNDIANAIALILMREVKPEEHGWHSYFNFPKRGRTGRAQRTSLGLSGNAISRGPA
jgi:hypothetical protein